jgi:hypothetical protein
MATAIERRAALAAFRALGTTATPDWIARVMQSAYVEDVARSLVMSGPEFRGHLLAGLGPGAAAAVLDELVIVLGRGIAQQDIDAARVLLGNLALEVARISAGTLPQDA